MTASALPENLPLQRAADEAPRDSVQRECERRRRRLQILAGVGASYAIDTLLLLVLAALGALDAQAAWAYGLAGAAACLLFYALLWGERSERLGDHYLAMPQMLVNATINLVFTAWQPQVGALLMMVLFIIFAFGALRMAKRQVLVCAFGIAVAAGALMVSLGGRLSMPMGSWQQSLACAIWFALVLARSTLVGLYGAKLRELLASRNAQLAATTEKLDVLANRDELTGALNRRSVMRLVEEERSRMERSGQPFGVAMFDLDHFKQINDSLGHLIGDDVLRRFVQRAGASLRNTDRLGRYGGEEFLMLLVNVADDGSAFTGADRLRLSISTADWSDLTPGRAVTVSAGVVACRPGESVQQLLGRADAALYSAKREGRNCVRIG